MAHAGGPLPHFAPPAPPAGLSFGPLALSAAFGRNSLRRRGPALLHVAQQGAFLWQLPWLVRSGPQFELSPLFHYLDDDERRILAGRFGSAVTELYMNALGYAWCVNAEEAALPGASRFDFLYQGGAAGPGSVVAVEAHGTLRADASRVQVARQVRGKYRRQVERHLGHRTAFGVIGHGYGVAFGSRPGQPGAFLCVAETSSVSPASAPATRPVVGGATAAMLLRSHRPNLALMGADSATTGIDRLLGRADEGDAVDTDFFRLVEADGLRFLVGSPPFGPWIRAVERWPFLPWRDGWGRRVPDLLRRAVFALEERVARTVLGTLSHLLAAKWGSEGSPSLGGIVEQPVFPPIGFAGEGGEEEGPVQVMFPDGFALLNGSVLARRAPLLRWSPTAGLVEEG